MYQQRKNKLRTLGELSKKEGGGHATNLDDNNGLLDDVVDLCLDQVEQDFNAAVGGPLNLHGTNANGADGLAHKVDINFRGVLLQFSKNLLNVGVICDPHQNLKLRHFHVDGVIVFAEEHLVRGKRKKEERTRKRRRKKKKN